VQHCALGCTSASAAGKHATNSLGGPHVACALQQQLLSPPSKNTGMIRSSACTCNALELIVIVNQAAAQIDQHGSNHTQGYM